MCFHRNSPKYSNDQGGKLDWNWLKFYGERNTGLRAINYSAKLQTTKQTFTTSKHAIEFTYSDFNFLAILKWRKINLRWLIVDGCVREGKRLTITVSF